MQLGLEIKMILLIFLIYVYFIVKSLLDYYAYLTRVVFTKKKGPSSVIKVKLYCPVTDLQNTIKQTNKQI